MKTAYLNAPIECELFMEQADDYERKGPNGEKLMFKLRKSLYGIKQSGRNWNNVLHEHFAQNGFVQSLGDPCVHVKSTESVFYLQLCGLMTSLLQVATQMY